LLGADVSAGKSDYGVRTFSVDMLYGVRTLSVDMLYGVRTISVDMSYGVMTISVDMLSAGHKGDVSFSS
jgi:hypothetical protein